MINLLDTIKNPRDDIEILLNQYRSVESAKDVVYKYIDVCGDGSDLSELTHLYCLLKQLLFDLDATISWLKL